MGNKKKNDTDFVIVGDENIPIRSKDGELKGANKMSKKKRKFKIKKLNVNWKLVGLFIGAGAVCFVVGSCNGRKKLKEEYREANLTAATSEASTDEETPTEEYVEKEYFNLNDVLNEADINEDKKQAFRAVWNHVTYYDSVVAGKHSDKKRLRKTFDDAMAQYLYYNNIADNPDKIAAIFDNYEITGEHLLACYNSGIKEDKKAYGLITEGTDKTYIVNSIEQEFYDKYEGLIARFNSSESEEERIAVAEEFYRGIRIDYHIGQESDSNSNKKAAILPMVEAFMEMTEDLDCDYKLDETEKSELFTIKDEDIADIFNQIASHNYGVDYIEDEFSYEELRNIAIDELVQIDPIIPDEETTEELTEEVTTEETVTEETTETVTEDSNTTETSYDEDSNNNSDNDNTNSDDSVNNNDDKSDAIPDWMKEDTTQDTTYPTDTDSEPFIDEDVPEVEQDTPDVSYDSLKQEYYNAIANAIIKQMSKTKVTTATKSFVKKA